MRFINFCNFIIPWSFYLLFFLVPIVFAGDTSELFEFNKMWLTFGLSILIGASWISKMIAQKQLLIQKTLLDIPILLFLLSQIISTFHSLDQYISWWGYYSRFNGGLLSTITYIFLYYAFVTNFTKKHVINVLKISLISGLFVSLWGLPAHFGYDPTCFIFRGNFDVSCWTAAFQPKARIFSTMGQPDWLAAYLLILIPISITFGLNAFKKSKFVNAACYLLLTVLFYADFLYTRSKGNFVAFVIPAVIFIPAFFWITKISFAKAKYLLGTLVAIVLITFFIGTPFPEFSRFTFTNLLQKLSTPAPIQAPSLTPSKPQKQENANPITGELGGSDSGKIRLFVWKGAIDSWKHNILFGTGVETFAFAYYKYRPAGHNLTSEWDYLYNKAHNEYLNYLATTGAFGLLTYVAIIGLFLFLAAKFIITKRNRIPFEDKQKSQVHETLTADTLILFSLVTSFLTILISNFFGFSVVMINIYFFLIPAFFLVLAGQIKADSALYFPKQSSQQPINAGQWLGISIVWLIAFYFLAILINYWNADKAYGLGLNLDRVGQYQSAYTLLHQAVSARPDEPVFKDELTVNDAAMSLEAATQKDATTAGKLANEAIEISSEITTNHPNNLTFWKTRTRVMFTLGEIDPRYFAYALDAIQKSHELAPTDAKISYNLGLLYNQTNQLSKAVETLKQTVQLKPDYTDAYYALAVVLHQQAIDKNNKIIDPAKEKEAETNLRFILNILSPNDLKSKDSLKSWSGQTE